MQPITKQLLPILSLLSVLFLFIGCTTETEKTNEKYNILFNSNDDWEDSGVDCMCFNGIGSSEGDEPILVSKFSNGTSLSLCGYFDKGAQDQGLTMSEFNVFNCITKEALVEYDALQTCRIEEKKDVLLIRELKYLPAGEDWDWEMVQISRQEISLIDGEINVSDPIPDLAKFEIDEAIQKEFIGNFKSGSGFGSESESEIAKLEVLSLIGNENAWNILKNYEKFSGEYADGSLSEQLNDAVATVNWIKGESNK